MERERHVYITFIIVASIVFTITSIVTMLELERLSLRLCRLSDTVDSLKNKTAPLDYVEKKDWQVIK